MNKLPQEILRQIFILLDFTERIKCLLVCRDWWINLDKHTLFYSIKIEKENDRFTRVINMFEQSPDSAACVKEFCAVLKTDTQFNRRKLFTIFPNASVMRLESDLTAEYLTLRHFKQNLDIAHSTSKVETLCDFYHCEYFSQLVYSNLGERLKTLYLKFDDESGTSNILIHLKGLAVLKKLTLDSPTMNINDLEKLHENIPSLEELALKEVELEISDMPSSIIPATFIKMLEYDNGYYESKEMLVQFYQYMIKKYAKITHSQYHDATPMFKFRSTPDRNEIYSKIFVDLYKLIGPRQSQLAFYEIPKDFDPFKTLDVVDSQMKSLSFHHCEDGAIYQHFARSDQPKYIQKIDIRHEFYYPIHYFKTMTILTELTLFIYRKLPLSECLDACPPSLKHLTIRTYGLFVEPYTRQLDSIETLTIDCKPIPALGDIISSCFPNLIKLNMAGDIKQSINIKLCNPDFRSATFGQVHTSQNKDGVGFSLRMPDQIEPQYYLCYGDKKTRMSYKEIQKLPILSVVSLTKKRLNLNGENAYIELLPC